MSLSIERIVFYKCPICKTQRKTERLIQQCLESCLEIQRAEKIHSDRINTVRLQATSSEHFAELIIKYSKEWYNVEVRFDSIPDRLQLCNASHNSPVGLPTNWCGRNDDKGYLSYYLGYSGNWKGEVSGRIPNLGKVDYGTFGEVGRWAGIAFIEAMFPGMNLGSGNGGQNFRQDGILFMRDFPLMREVVVHPALMLLSPDAVEREHIEHLVREDEFEKTYKQKQARDI